MEEANKIELYSEEVQDLLGTPPRWLIRWGTVVFFFVIAALIGLSAWVIYPDVVRAKVSITTPFPPTPIVTRTAGVLQILHFADGDSIVQGAVLGVLDNAAKYQDVASLEEQLLNIQGFTPTSILSFQPKNKLQLGNLQNAYSDFLTLFEDYQTALAANFDIKKIKQLQQQIENITALNEKLNSNQKTIAQAVKVAADQLDRQKILLAKGAVAQINVEDANVLYLEALRSKEQHDLEMMNNQLKINEIEREITTIQKDIKVTKSANFTRLEESIKRLQSEIETWKTTYVLTAPISGILDIPSTTKVKQYLSQETTIALILAQQNSIIGKLALQMKGSGKVKIGNKVIIKLDGYPYQEYGFVRGTIADKPAVPRKGTYDVEVALSDGLKTSRGRVLVFEEQVEGTAEIITDSRSLLRRVFDQLLTALESVNEK